MTGVTSTASGRRPRRNRSIVRLVGIAASRRAARSITRADSSGSLASASRRATRRARRRPSGSNSSDFRR